MIASMPLGLETQKLTKKTGAYSIVGHEAIRAAGVGDVFEVRSATLGAVRQAWGVTTMGLPQAFPGLLIGSRSLLFGLITIIKTLYSNQDINRSLKSQLIIVLLKSVVTRQAGSSHCCCAVESRKTQGTTNKLKSGRIVHASRIRSEVPYIIDEASRASTKTN